MAIKVNNTVVIDDSRVLTNTTIDCSNEPGFRNVPTNSNSANYTCVLTDAGKCLLHPSADVTSRTFTIPSNASVAYPLGTVLTFVNQNGAGTMSISIDTDVMRLGGAGTTGTRTLLGNGLATAIKVGTTEWLITGTGLS